MQVQGVNNSNHNNTNFGAIMKYVVKGKDFRANPEMAQEIFKRFAPKDTFAFDGSIAKAILKSKNYKSFSSQMIYGTDMPFSNGVTLSVYERPDGNAAQRVWKYIKASLAYVFNKESHSSAYREVIPSELSGYGNSFKDAVKDMINQIDRNQIPSKYYYMERTTH